MAEELEPNLDERVDLAAEGLRSPDEVDLAQDREDRQAAASQTETAEEEDLTGERFAYTLSNGEDFEGTIAEITAKEAELLADARVAEKMAEIKPVAEKPVEAKPEVDTGETIPPVQWDKVGSTLTEMLEEGKSDEIGPALLDMNRRMIATDPFIASVVENYVNYLLDQREQGTKVKTSFQEFVGDEIPATEVQTFMQANPWAKSQEMAVLGIKTARANQEIADLKAGKVAAVKDAEVSGKRTGAKETIQNLKAKGQLRRIGGTGGKPGGNKSTLNLKDPNQRLAGAVAFLQGRDQGRT